MNQAGFTLVYEKFFSRLERVYGSPDTTDVEGFFNEYYNALKKFTEAQLTTGADRIIASRTHKSWPTAGVCVQFCSSKDPESKNRNGYAVSVNDAQEWMGRIERRLDAFVNGGDDLAKWAASFRNLPLVCRAEANGWGTALRSAVRFAVKRDLMAERKLGEPESYMPRDQRFIEYSEDHALAARMAVQWRKDNPDHPMIRPMRQADGGLRKVTAPSAPRGSTIRQEADHV